MKRKNENQIENERSIKIFSILLLEMIVDPEIENKEIAKQYKELLRISYQTLSENDKKMIRLAFDTAVEAHRNQRRKSGEPIFSTPFNVAKIVAHQIGLDATSSALHFFMM